MIVNCMHHVNIMECNYKVREAKIVCNAIRVFVHIRLNHILKHTTLAPKHQFNLYNGTVVKDIEQINRSAILSNLHDYFFPCN